MMHGRNVQPQPAQGTGWGWTSHRLDITTARAACQPKYVAPPRRRVPGGGG
ncbi:hypothetical protein KSF73_02430 [Burkholderiaceae bacterium DAT-1]|nr:hypothetical protein [Burkholderiaceae bacterium DAT-1]